MNISENFLKIIFVAFNENLLRLYLKESEYKTLMNACYVIFSLISRAQYRKT